MSYVLLNKATNQFAKLASYIGKRAEYAIIQDNMNFDMRESIERDVIKILESINTLNGTSSAAKYVNDVYVKQKNNDEYFVEVIFSSECNYDYEREELYLDYSDFDNMVNEYMRKASEKFDVVAIKIVDEETISGYNHDEIKFPEHKEKTVKMLVRAVDISKSASSIIDNNQEDITTRDKIERIANNILKSIHLNNGKMNAFTYVGDLIVNEIEEQGSGKYLIDVLFMTTPEKFYDVGAPYLNDKDFDMIINEFVRKVGNIFDLREAKAKSSKVIDSYEFDDMKRQAHKEKIVQCIVEEKLPVDISKSASEKRCNCENDECAGHKAGSCKNHAGKRKALYVGALCDECAKNMPKEFMKE